MHEAKKSGKKKLCLIIVCLFTNKDTCWTKWTGRKETRLKEQGSRPWCVRETPPLSLWVFYVSHRVV